MDEAKAPRRLRRAARIVGLIIAATWVISLLIQVIAEWGTPIILEGIILGILATINVASVIVSWWFPKIGGILLIVFGTAFFIFGYITAGHNEIFAALISGFPFIVAGILFVLSWWRAQKK
jgi:hypothetical protein